MGVGLEVMVSELEESVLEGFEDAGLEFDVEVGEAAFESGEIMLARSSQDGLIDDTHCYRHPDV